ncbi:hypothetical protein [Spirosoma aerolatum]|uniref:hypothetical protein n=1 Tax=Spirosoma aerolatum TaxID=1211326 RepID=UPI0009AC4801|nr:hypothetical protein [Spirosoma aerolatum]
MEKVKLLKFQDSLDYLIKTGFTSYVEETLFNIPITIFSLNNGKVMAMASGYGDSLVFEDITIFNKNKDAIIKLLKITKDVPLDNKMKDLEKYAQYYIDVLNNAIGFNIDETDETYYQNLHQKIVSYIKNKGLIDIASELGVLLGELVKGEIKAEWRYLKKGNDEYIDLYDKTRRLRYSIWNSTHEYLEACLEGEHIENDLLILAIEKIKIPRNDY